MKKLKDKVAVVTGAGSGIGRALAIQFANEGTHLALNDFNKERLAETVDLCSSGGVDIYHECFDVSKREAFYSFADNVLEKFKGVDIVINNAGVALGKYSVLEATIEDIEWIFGINFWGVVYGTKAFLPSLLKRQEASVVNISSLFGIAGVSFQAPYCATKFAVRGFTESLRMEMLDTNVCVHVVHPGGIKTNIAKDSRSHLADSADTIKKFEKMFIHSPEMAAETIIKGIKKKNERILIGQETVISDMVIRLAPVGYSKIVNRVLMNSYT